MPITLDGRTMACAQTLVSTLLSGAGALALVAAAALPVGRADAAPGDGSAARQTMRYPDAMQYEQEAAQQRLAAHLGQPIQDRFALFADIIAGDATLEGRGSDIPIAMEGATVLAGGRMALAHNWDAGLAMSYGEHDGKAGGSDIFDSRARALHGWAGRQIGAGQVRLQGSYGWGKLEDIRRATGVDLLSASGETDLEFWDVALAGTRSMEAGPLTLHTQVAVHVGEMVVGGYAESGADGLALSYGKQRKKVRRLDLSLDGEGPSFNLGAHTSLTPVAGVHWRYGWDKRSHRLTAQLIGNSADPVMLRSGGDAAHRVDASVGLNLDVGKASFGARYTRRWASDLESADACNLFVRMAF